MKDLNSENKHICNYCNQNIDFIWSSGINNSSSFARLCYDCKNKIISEAYKKIMVSFFIISYLSN